MWKIDDDKARAFVTALFPDETEISDAYEYQKDNSNDSIELTAYEGFKAKAKVRIKKSLFKKVRNYLPFEWNPYPEVKPPKRGYYLVTRLRNRDNGDTYKGVDLCLFGLNNSDIFAQSNVLAFRELPEPYDPMPWEEDDEGEPEEGD